jgi:hypothetical protein
MVGRAGLEPATLGLKVRREPSQQTAREGKWLQGLRTDLAANRNQLRVAETTPYSHSYSSVAVTSHARRLEPPSRPEYPRWQTPPFVRVRCATRTSGRV